MALGKAENNARADGTGSLERDGSGRGLDCEKWKNKHVQANLCLTINGRDAQKLNFLPRPVNCFFILQEFIAHDEAIPATRPHHGLK